MSLPRPSNLSSNFIFSTNYSSSSTDVLDIHPLCECILNMLLDAPINTRPETMSVTYDVPSSSAVAACSVPVPTSLVARFAQQVTALLQRRQRLRRLHERPPSQAQRTVPAEATLPAVWIHLGTSVDEAWFERCFSAVVDATDGAVAVSDKIRHTRGVFVILRSSLAAPGNAAAAMLLVDVRDGYRHLAMRIARKMLVTVPYGPLAPVSHELPADCRPSSDLSATTTTTAAIDAAVVGHVVGAYFARGFLCIDVRLADTRQLVSLATAAPLAFSFLILLCTRTGTPLPPSAHTQAEHAVRSAASTVRYHGAIAPVQVERIDVQPTWGRGRVAALRIHTLTAGCALAIRVLLHETLLSDCPLADWLPPMPATSMLTASMPPDLYTVGARVCVALSELGAVDASPAATTTTTPEPRITRVLPLEDLTRILQPPPAVADPQAAAAQTAAASDHTAVCLSFDELLDSPTAWRWVCLAVVRTSDQAPASFVLALYTPADTTAISTKAALAMDAENHERVCSLVAAAAGSNDGGGGGGGGGARDRVLCVPNLLAFLLETLKTVDPDSVVFHGNSTAAKAFVQAAHDQAACSFGTKWAPRRDGWLPTRPMVTPVPEPVWQSSLPGLGVGYLHAEAARCVAALAEVAPDALHLFHTDAAIKYTQESWGSFLPAMLLSRARAVCRLLESWVFTALGRTELLRVPVSVAARCGTADLAAWRLIVESRVAFARAAAAGNPHPWVAWVHPYETVGVRPDLVTYAGTDPVRSSSAGGGTGEPMFPTLADDGGPGEPKRRRIAPQTVGRDSSNDSWYSVATTTTATTATDSSSSWDSSQQAPMSRSLSLTGLAVPQSGSHARKGSAFLSAAQQQAGGAGDAFQARAKPLTAGPRTIKYTMAAPAWFSMQTNRAAVSSAPIGQVAARPGVLPSRAKSGEKQTRIGGRKRRDPLPAGMQKALQTHGFIRGVEFDLRNAYPSAFERNNLGPTTSMLLEPGAEPDAAAAGSTITLDLSDGGVGQLWSCTSGGGGGGGGGGGAGQTSIVADALREIKLRRAAAIQKAAGLQGLAAKSLQGLAAEAKQILVSTHGCMRVDMDERYLRNQHAGKGAAGVACYIASPIHQLIGDAAVLDVRNRISRVLRFYGLDVPNARPTVSHELRARGVIGMTLVSEVTDGVLLGLAMVPPRRAPQQQADAPVALDAAAAAAAAPAPDVDQASCDVEVAAAAIAASLATLDIGDHVVQAVPFYCEDATAMRVVSLSTPVGLAQPPQPPDARPPWHVKILPRTKVNDWPFLTWVLKALAHVRPADHVAGTRLSAAAKWRAMREFVQRAHAEVLRGNVLATELETLVDGAPVVLVAAARSVNAAARERTVADPVVPIFETRDGGGGWWDQDPVAADPAADPAAAAADLATDSLPTIPGRLHFTPTDEDRWCSAGPWVREPLHTQPPAYKSSQASSASAASAAAGKRPEARRRHATGRNVMAVRDVVTRGVHADHKAYAAALLARFPPPFVEAAAAGSTNESAVAAFVRANYRGAGGAGGGSGGALDDVSVASRATMSAHIRVMHKWAAAYLDAETHTCVTECDAYGWRSCAACGIFPDSARGALNFAHVLTREPLDHS